MKEIFNFLIVFFFIITLLFSPIIAYWEEFEQKQSVGEQGGIATPVKFCIFYPHLSLETVFLALPNF